MKIIVIILLLSLFQSCSIDSKKDLDFTIDSFKETNIIQGEKISYKDLILSNPRWIKYHNDSFLIISELSSSSDLIKIVDLKNGNVQELIPSGRGPGEMLTVWGIGVVENKIWAYDPQQRKVCILNSNSNRRFSIIKEFFLEEKSVLSACILNDSIIACLCGLGEKCRLKFFNFSGKHIRTVGEVPPLLNDEKIMSDNLIFMSKMANIENSLDLVLACVSIDIFEIYNFENGLKKRITGPIGIELTAERVNVGMGYKTRLHPKYSTYSNVTATDTAIWISYSGYLFDDNEKRTHDNVYPKKILCFSRQGDPLSILEFQNNIMYFDMDWNNKIIYTLEQEEHVPIIKKYLVSKYGKG